jgi:hypothetical protein
MANIPPKYQNLNKEVAGESDANICETINRFGVQVDRNIIGMFET